MNKIESEKHNRVLLHAGTLSPTATRHVPDVVTTHTATRCSEAELREEPQVLARAVAVLKDVAQLLLDLAAQTLARVVRPLPHDAGHVLRVERVAVVTKNK